MCDPQTIGQSTGAMDPVSCMCCCGWPLSCFPMYTSSCVHSWLLYPEVLLLLIFHDNIVNSATVGWLVAGFSTLDIVQKFLHHKQDVTDRKIQLDTKER